jgi:large subunit ribosomal protein L29
VKGDDVTKKAHQLRDDSETDLRAELARLRDQLFKLRWQATSGQVENPSRIRAVRRDIARHLTALRQRELTAGAEAKA